ncbi:MAG: dTDP-glucose 4,6-dehydratase [Desulfatibacillaceae bacterium]
MKNLLVTGGCGFIGANFVRYVLGESGFSGRLVNVDKLTYAGNPNNLDGVAETYGDRYVFVREDIADADAMERVFDEYGIDSVCHLAAESHVDRSIHGPADFVRTNVMGTFVLLEQARRHQDRMELFHHVSTDEVYGSLGMEGLFTEDTPYRPSSPYSASKAGSDHMVRAWHVTYGLPVTISNCSNNYGPYQFPEKLIPLMILNSLEGESLPVYGEGKNVRDWLHVQDHCEALWLIMQKGRRGQTYNIGGDGELANIEVVRTLCDIVDRVCGTGPAGPRRRLVTFVKDRPGHDLRYAIDFSKLRNELGWQPRRTFAQGLEATVRWYVENAQWVKDVRSGSYRDWIEKHYGG